MKIHFSSQKKAKTSRKCKKGNFEHDKKSFKSKKIENGVFELEKKEKIFFCPFV